SHHTKEGLEFRDGGCWGRTDFRRGSWPEKKKGKDCARHGVGDNHSPITGDGRHRSSLKTARNGARRERPERRREGTRERVPGEHFGAGSWRYHVREGRLLDREKRSDLVAAWTDHADRSRYDQKKQVMRTAHRQPAP